MQRDSCGHVCREENKDPQTTRLTYEGTRITLLRQYIPVVFLNLSSLLQEDSIVPLDTTFLYVTVEAG